MSSRGLKRKVLLMGKSGSGKTSMRSIIFANYLARDTMRLGPTLGVENSHVRFLGNLVLNLWDCLTDDHQILTSNGFLFVDEFLQHTNDGLLTASYDPLEKKIVYVPASKVIVKPAAVQEVVEFTSASESNPISLVVTPGHTMYAQKGRAEADGNGIQWVSNKGPPSFTKAKADSFLSNDPADYVRFLRAAENGVMPQTLVLDVGGLPFVRSEDRPDGLPLTTENEVDAFLQLYGFWAAEMTQTESAIEVTAKNPNEAAFVRHVLSTLQYCISNVSEVMAENSEVRFRIADPQWSRYFVSQTSNVICDGIESARAFFPWVLTHLDQRHLRLLLDGLTCAMGLNGSVVTPSSHFRDEVLIACLHAGFAAYFTRDCGMGSSDENIWRVHFSVESHQKFGDVRASDEIKKVAYNGRVWCVNVEPHHLIVTRRAERSVRADGTVEVTKASQSVIIGNCGGQDAFMENYFESQRDQIFRNVEVLIYVFDIESQERKKDVEQYENCINAIKQNSKNAHIFCLVHKMDVIQKDEDKLKIFEEREKELKRISDPLKVTCFGTSIWDETLYKAWSSIVYALVPNVEKLESQLDKFCSLNAADEVVLFEKATFLVISHATHKEHADQHRYEKISNIIKQFKLSCSKTQAQFKSMEVKNKNFTAFIDVFTTNTYVMMIVTDERVQSAGINHNIQAARPHFERFVQQNMY